MPAVRLGDADAEAMACVEVASTSTVDVIVAPVLIPDGPMTMGTMTWSVLPLPSIVVLVIVVCIVLLSTDPSSLALIVVCSEGLDSVVEKATRDVCETPSVPETAA